MGRFAMNENSIPLDPEFRETIGKLAGQNLEIFTPEGKIICHLLNHGRSRIKELILVSGVSYRGFYLALDRLRKAKAVEMSTDPHDRRVKLVELHEELKPSG